MVTGRDIWTYYEGTWHQGNYPILGAADHGAWLGTMVFDGARAFEGVTPDLDLHCARTVDSARKMGLNPPLSAGEVFEIAKEGVAKIPKRHRALHPSDDVAAGRCTASMVLADPDSTAFALCLEARPMPGANGFSITTTQFTQADVYDGSDGRQGRLPLSEQCQDVTRSS